MPRSVRSLIHKCLHKGAITQEEHDKIIRKLDKAMEWIPCSERLPERDTQVLCTLRLVAFDYMTVMWIDETTGEWANGDNYNSYLDGEVIAWMPLPEPYEGKEN